MTENYLAPSKAALTTLNQYSWCSRIYSQQARLIHKDAAWHPLTGAVTSEDMGKDQDVVGMAFTSLKSS